MDSNQNNNQNDQIVQDQTQVLKQQQVSPSIVSAPQGIKEGPPAVVEGSDKVSEEGIEDHIEHGPEFAPPPQVSAEVANAGVVSHHSDPKIDEHTKIAESIPSEINRPSYKFEFKDKEEAVMVAKNGPMNSARTWMAVIWQKLLGQKENQPQTL